MNYVIFKADGSVNKQNFEYYVQQGDNNNQFFIGLAGGLASDSAVGVCVLPNGSTNVISGVWNANYEYAEGETADGWLFSLTTDQTEYNGLLQVSLYVSRGPTIKVSYPIGIIINETGVRPDLDTGITIEELNSYLVELQKYALKDHVIYLENLLTSSDTLQTVGTGPHFIKMSDDDDGIFYFITIKDVGSGYDFSAINLSDPKKYYHGVVPSSTPLGMALSSTYLDELVDLTSEQTITGKKTLASTGDITPATGSTYEVGSSSKPYNNVNTNSVNGISVSSFENKNNKVVSINGSSTDTQYPSAKCVYDNVQDVREIAAGKSANYSLSYNATAPSPMSYNAYYYIDADAQIQHFTSYDEMNTYMTGLSIYNANFNSQNNSVTFSGAASDTTHYLLISDSQGRSIVAKISTLYKLLKMGDNFFVTETDVPDRWVQTSNAMSIAFYKLETAKMSDYYSKSESLLPTSSGTYNIGGNGATWNDLWLSGKIQFSTNANTYITSNSDGDLLLRGAGGTIWAYQQIKPINNGTQNLGSSSNAWKDLYLSGKIDFGNNALINKDASDRVNISYGGSVKFKIGNDTIVIGHFKPDAPSSYDLGTSSLKWRNFYLAGYIKGAATLTQAQYDALVSGGTVDADTFYFIEEE